MIINYNLSGQERKPLVKALEELSGQKANYLGSPSMAYQIGSYQLGKNGELSFEESNDTECLIEQLTERGFDGIIELPEDSGEDSDAYLTVSVPLKNLDHAAQDNLHAIIKAKGNLIKKALGTDGLPILYRRDEICFPWFKEETSPEEAQAYMNFISKLCAYAKSLVRVSATEKKVENEKYAFRCFLLRLGFIGDEYKADRKVLMQNLSGNAAFRDGKAKNASCSFEPDPRVLALAKIMDEITEDAE